MKDIVIKDLCKRFGEKTVLRGFSAVIPAGGVLGIMGESGCGKTTLLRILLGLERADGGTIEGLPARISAVFQEERLCDEFSAVTNVAIAAPRKTPRAAIEDCLSALGLGADLDRPVRELSGGMRRRVAIVRALLAEGELLLLDEPFKGLDEATRAQTAAYLLAHTEGRTVLLVTHDREEAALLGAEELHGIFEDEPPRVS
jgi:NitT/TauT family transport system ATP-binding protein